MQSSSKHSIVVVDDHVLFASSLQKLVNTFMGFEVLYHASNGKDLQQKFKDGEELPKMILLDINMPIMDGYETALWLKNTHPDIRVIALSMNDNEQSIIKMLRLGVKGYVLKDTNPNELEAALLGVLKNGYYHSDRVAEALLHSIQPDHKNAVTLKDKEIEFLKLSCTERTYREIAELMALSPKTIDGYRQDLFEKLGVRNRVGLVMYALKNHIVEL